MGRSSTPKPDSELLAEAVELLKAVSRSRSKTAKRGVFGYVVKRDMDAIDAFLKNNKSGSTNEQHR